MLPAPRISPIGGVRILSTSQEVESIVSTDPLRKIRSILEKLPEDDRHAVIASLRESYPIHQLEIDWNVRAEVILEAIARSPDITQRGLRGVLAQAACKAEVIDRLDGWVDDTPPGNMPFDFRLRRGDTTVTIQVKLQRKVQGRPMRADEAAGLNDPDQLVVETQRTRGGTSRDGEATRPYRVGEFDILAVSLEPSTRNWAQFRFTVASWLIRRNADPSRIAVYQPVALSPNDDWTDSLLTCLDWWASSRVKTIRGGGVKPPRRRKD